MLVDSLCIPSIVIALVLVVVLDSAAFLGTGQISMSTLVSICRSVSESLGQATFDLSPFRRSLNRYRSRPRRRSRFRTEGAGGGIVSAYRKKRTFHLESARRHAETPTRLPPILLSLNFRRIAAY